MPAHESLPFILHSPNRIKLPILISAPHVGTLLPDDLKSRLNPELASTLPDTDWLVHELYNFCQDLGIPMLRAVYSRYTVDLNRPAEGPLLYTDARAQTEVLPLRSFGGENLYQSGDEPGADERALRLKTYYHPYHEMLAEQLALIQSKFGKVVLFDAHSIKRFVPSLAAEPFADMIVGDRDGQSAEARVSRALLATLQQSNYRIAYNQPFKGGQITRCYGQPKARVHAVQLEMAQDIYLKADEIAFDESKVSKLRPLLKRAILALAVAME